VALTLLAGLLEHGRLQLSQLLQRAAVRLTLAACTRDAR
jgi:hypothetical protein